MKQISVGLIWYIFFCIHWGLWHFWKSMHWGIMLNKRGMCITKSAAPPTVQSHWFNNILHITVYLTLNMFLFAVIVSNSNPISQESVTILFVWKFMIFRRKKKYDGCKQIILKCTNETNYPPIHQNVKHLQLPWEWVAYSMFMQIKTCQPS